MNAGCIELFNKNIEGIKELNALYPALCSKLSSLNHLDDILRSEVVLLVSALDNFVHDVVRDVIVELFIHEKTFKQLDKFSIQLSSFGQMLNSSRDERSQFLKIAVEKELSNKSFQSPTNIEKILKSLSIGNLWNLLDKKMGSSRDVKKELGLIINRRNKIAHEADLVDKRGVKKNEIKKEDVDEMILFIEKFVKALYEIIESEVFK